MEMKGKLYLRILLLTNYMMEKNLFVNVEQSPVKHAAASRFYIRKKDKKRVTTEWTDIHVLLVCHPEAPCTTLC